LGLHRNISSDRFEEIIGLFNLFVGNNKLSTYSHLSTKKKKKVAKKKKKLYYIKCFNFFIINLMEKRSDEAISYLKN
jgi:hypothetical protein